MKRHLIRDTCQAICDYFKAGDSKIEHACDEEIKSKMQDFCDQYSPAEAWLQDADNF